MKRTEIVVLVLIMAIAAGFRLYGLHETPPGLYPDEAMVGNEAIHAWETKDFAIFYPHNNGEEGLYANLASLPIHAFGNSAFALRLTSVIAGLLTVLGTYLLARCLFDNWEIAAISAFLMATGLWHVNFSRIGFRAILAPLMAVWGLYHFYRGIETHRVWYWVAAGFFLGLGFHTYIAFRVLPLVVVATLAAYWLAVRKSFHHDKYSYTRGQMLGGIAALVGIFILTVMPLAIHFAQNPQDFSGRATQVSIFSAEQPLTQAGINLARTLGMFIHTGDGNWRHGLGGQPVLFWPISALFVVGLLRTIYKILHTWRLNGHPSVVHVLLLSWFIVGITPTVLSNEGIPHALRSITASPAVYIIAGQGVWWFYVWFKHWYSQRDTHKICLPGPNGHQWCFDEGRLIVGFTLVAFLFAMGVAEGHRYFVQWAQNPITPSYFNQNYVLLADRLNALPPATLKYVVVNAGGVLVNGIPMPSQTVMYLTDTWTPEKQKAKNIYYITKEQFDQRQYPKGALVIQLEP